MSRIRADKFVNNAATGAPQLTYGAEVVAGVGLTGAGGINVTGVITATSFSGDGSGLTGVASTDNIITGTAATFTNVVKVGTAITIDATSGIVTATSFSGSTGSFTGDVDIADKIIHTAGALDLAIAFVALERVHGWIGGHVAIDDQLPIGDHVVPAASRYLAKIDDGLCHSPQTLRYQRFKRHYHFAAVRDWFAGVGARDVIRLNPVLVKMAGLHALIPGDGHFARGKAGAPSVADPACVDR